MPTPPPDRCVGRLCETQRELARSLRAGATSDGAAAPLFIAPPPVGVHDRLAVYRNNTRQFFRTALELTYPVLVRRVGTEYFRHLAHEYRECHPSRSGDLHWVGQAFPAWLEQRLRATDYAWLADLARLEWACEEAHAAGAEPAATLESLGRVPAESLDGARVQLQPSLRLVESPWPVWSVWQANQGEHAGAPVDLQAGPEHCACACTDDRVAVYRLDAEHYAALARLAGGAPLAEAAATAASGPDALARVLGWAFGAGLVVAVSPCGPA